MRLSMSIRYLGRYKHSLPAANHIPNWWISDICVYYIILDSDSTLSDAMHKIVERHADAMAALRFLLSPG